MLDFDGIVLSALQNTFSRRITVQPVASQPGAASYDARGIYSTGPVDILTDVNATVISDQKTAVWIRASEYTIQPQIGDKVDVPAFLTAPAEGLFEIIDVDRHAPGKVILTLRKLLTQP